MIGKELLAIVREMTPGRGAPEPSTRAGCSFLARTASPGPAARACCPGRRGLALL